MIRPRTTTEAHRSSAGTTAKLVRAPRRRILGVALVTAVTIGGSLGAGACTAAATAPRQAAASVHGTVNVTIWSIDSDGADFQAIVSGAIGDYGPAVTVLPDGKVDPEHTSEMELKLHHGTFRLRIAGIVSELSARASHEPTYQATCSDYFDDITATVPIVTGSGTGAYRGVHGSLSVSLTVNEDQQTPPCTPPFARQIIILNGSGNVSY